jgi:hypothetical protein
MDSTENDMKSQFRRLQFCSDDSSAFTVFVGVLWTVTKSGIPRLPLSLSGLGLAKLLELWGINNRSHNNQMKLLSFRSCRKLENSIDIGLFGIQVEA